MGPYFGYIDYNKMKPDREMTKRCRRPKMCLYFSATTQTCDYREIVGERRPCPPGDQCTVKTTGQKSLRKNPWNDNMTVIKHRSPRKSKLEGNKQAERMYDVGASDPEIAEACGVSKATVVRWRVNTGRESNYSRGRPTKGKR